MTLFHLLLGSAVVLLNGATAVDGLVLADSGERFWQLGNLAHGTLALQVVSGFFLLTATSNGLSFVHVLAPAAALGLVVLARSRDTDNRGRLVAVASAFATAAAIYSFASGIAARG